MGKTGQVGTRRSSFLTGSAWVVAAKSPECSPEARLQMSHYERHQQTKELCPLPLRRTGTIHGDPTLCRLWGEASGYMSCFLTVGPRLDTLVIFREFSATILLLLAKNHKNFISKNHREFLSELDSSRTFHERNRPHIIERILRYIS